MVVQGPKGDFTPLEVILPAGSQLYRVLTNTSKPEANVFNPGLGAPTRFAHFGSPKVPTLYAAATEQSAVAETLLHDVPIEGGVLTPDDYEHRIMRRITTTRDLRLAKFMGDGFRALGAEASEITYTNSSKYPETVRWGEAAHEAGFDGCAWMSRQLNTDPAYVFFGGPGRVQEADLEIDPTYGRGFALPTDFDWLSDMCKPLRVVVRR